MNILSIIVEIIKIIGTGIVSGVIASLCYAGIKRLIRPRIDIAPFVIVHPTDKMIIVKYINHSRWWLAEVNAELFYYNIKGAEARFRGTRSKYPIPATMEKYKNDRQDVHSQSMYACQAGFLYDEIIEDVDFSKEDKMTLTIKAVHPLSGTVKYFSKDFHCNTIEEVRIGDNIVFTDGDNMQYKVL